MREFRFTFVILALILASAATFADPLVELAAPRVQAPKVISEDGTPLKSEIKKENKKTIAKPIKKHKKRIVKHIAPKKPIVIKVDYDKVSKMIEYNCFGEADKILKEAIARDPKDINAESLLVVSLAKQGKLEPAQNKLDTLLKKYPNNSNLHYAQGILYYQRTTSSNMFYRNNSQNLMNKALAEFKKAIELDKKNARAYNAAGVVSLKLDNPKDAIDYFNKSNEADKTYSMAIDNLGTIDFADGKLDEAEKKFKQSLTYNPQNTTAMYHLAQIAMQKNDYTNALFQLDSALTINPNSPAIYNLMGKAYLAQGNEAAAINAFKNSISVKPEFTLSYSDLAEVYEKRGDGEFAIEQLKTALSIDPTYNDAKLKIADISFANGKNTQAISVYSELVGVYGYNNSALKGLANAYYAQAIASSNKALLGSNKDLFKALEYTNKAISANPQDLELHLAKLKLTKVTNQPDETKVELNKIINSPNTDMTSLIVKGEAYLTLNDHQKAQKSFSDAAKLSKTTDEDLYLAEIFMYHKQFDCAEKIIQTILKNEPKNQEAISDFDYIQKGKKRANDYYNSAKYYIKMKNLNTATEYLSRSLSINPNNAQAHLLLAQIYEKQKEYHGAFINYQAYLNLEPNSNDAKKIKSKMQRLENRL